MKEQKKERKKKAGRKERMTENKIPYKKQNQTQTAISYRL